MGVVGESLNSRMSHFSSVCGGKIYDFKSLCV